MPIRPKVLDFAKMSLYAYENQAVNGAIPGWSCTRQFGLNDGNANGFFQNRIQVISEGKVLLCLRFEGQMIYAMQLYLMHS